MPRQYRPREVDIVVRHLGWAFSRYHGSHAIYRKQGASHVSIPENRREVAQGTLSAICRQLGISRAEFDKIAQEVL